MNRICKASILSVLLAAVLLGAPVITLGAVIEVSQPVQVTSDTYYERGQAIVYDGADYWLFYGRSASVTGWYQNGTPDVYDYQIYYKKASTVAGLVSATATAVPGAVNCYNGEIGAAVHGGNVWTFASVPSTNFTGRRSLYGWYSVDGTSWTQVADLADNMSDGAAHHDEVSFGGNLFIMADYPDGNAGWHTKYTADPTAGTITWSSYVPLATPTSLINGTGHFYAEGTELYIAILRTNPTKDNKVLQWVTSPEGWTEIATAVSTGWDPTLVKVGSTYLFAQAPYTSDGGGWQHIIGWSSTSLSTVLSGTPVNISSGKYGTNTWVDMWPIGFTDAGGTSYLFYTSERDVPSQEGTGNIWYLELDWDVSREHFTWAQEGIDAAVAADEVHIAAGTYEENVTIGVSLTLTGEQYGVDARVRSGDETILTCAAGHLVTVAVVDVVLDGLTLTGTAAAARLGNCDSHGSGFEMRNCIMDGTAQQGLWFNVTSPDIVLEYNVIDASLWTSYVAFFDGADVYDNLYIGENEFAGGGIFAGNDSYNSTGFQLVDNLFDGCVMNLSYQFQNATVSGNIFRNNGYTNLQAGFKNSTISYNQFEATGPSPHGGYPSCSMMLYGTVYGPNPAENVVIEGNTFDFNGFALPADAANGLRILAGIDASTITIRDNSFNDGAAQATAFAVLNQGTGDADASGNWWGSNDPATVNALANGGTLVDYTPWLDIGTDNRPGIGFEGDFSALHVDDDSPQTGLVGIVQEGIDLVDGSTVYVHDGTYVEQLEIDEDIVVQGDGPGTEILCPDNLPLFFVTSANNYPVVYIHDTPNAEIHDLTVNGAGKGNANTRFYGVAFRNAGGGVYDCSVLDIRDTPFSGAQQGVALYSYNDDLIGRSVDVHDCVITGFQKNAMALNAATTTPLAVDVRGNTITGAGTTTVTAQNGVQVWAVLGTGDIEDNVISGIAYSGGYWSATSILNYYGVHAIDGNTISGSHMGIYNVDGAGTISGNDVEVELIGGSCWGIQTSDPPKLKPSPFLEEEPLGASGRDMLKAPLALLDVDIIGNTVTNVGATVAGTYGIEADAGYGPDDLDVTISHNTICNFEAAIDIWACQSTCDTGVFTSVVCNYNYLGCGNTYGIRSNAAYIVTDGTNNWWGDASGPNNATFNPTGTGVEVSDYIDFDPWMGAENVVSVLPDYGTTNCTDPITFTFWFDHAGTTDEVRGVAVTFEVDEAVVDIVTIGGGSSDIAEGTYLPGFASPPTSVTTFFPLDKTGGEYTVSTSISGGSTGATGSGDLFTVEFTPMAQGLSAITITEVKVRDLNNVPLGSSMVGGEVRIDCTVPTMEAIAETQGQCYNTAPTFANFGFDDDQALDWAKYQIDTDGEVTIFTGINVSEWNDDGWALPGFAGLSEGLHTVYFYVADMAGNENGVAYSWSFIKDTVLPAAPTDFSAMPGHNKVHLTWTNPTGDASFVGVEIRLVAWGDYPEYLTAPSYPADHLDGTFVTQTSGGSYDDDHRTPRDIYYYAAFAYDCAGNYSVFDAGAADRSTSYWLGDIRSVYDGLVDGLDLLDFSNTFGLVQGGTGWNNEADFGPSDDWSRFGIPEPDDVIDFEDLMIFSMNYGNVDPLGFDFVPGEKSTENLENMVAFELVPATTDAGTIVSIVMSSRASTLKGARLLIETGDGCEIINVSKGDAIAKRGDVFFGTIPSFGGMEVCVAALGVDKPLAGSGEVAKILVKSGSSINVSLAEADIRDIENRQFVLEGTGSYEGPEIPIADALNQNFPNPFNPATTVVFDLAKPAMVRIGIYDVSGRLVRTLVDRSMEAGSHEVGWNGTNNLGTGVPSGLYFYRMTTSDGFTATRKMILLR